MIDPPRGAMRPVHRDAVTELAAEQFVARDSERLCLGVEQRILDGADRLGSDPASRLARHREEIRKNTLMRHGGLAATAWGTQLDHRADARRGEPLVELAPTDDPVIG